MLSYISTNFDQFNENDFSIGYRELNYDAARPAQKLGAELCAGFMWWWIGWHFITDWRHLVGKLYIIFIDLRTKFIY